VNAGASRPPRALGPSSPHTGRYLRLTLQSNQGAPDYVELMGFAAYGKVIAKLPIPDVSGTFDSMYGNFRIAATGATATGCYEHNKGLIQNGGFDGRVLRFTWAEQSDDGKTNTSGPAVLVFYGDGKSFLGLWWRGANVRPDGRWTVS
jgi:hypothetical protein